MMIQYLPILILFIIAAGFAITNIGLSAVLGRRKPTAEKLSPYECGIDPVGTARERFSVKFYLIAMIFVIFDIEVVFLYPWAVAFKELKLFGFIEMLIFVGILLVCYLYIWKRGGLEWD
ncbi:MAG: NADH-quinone oxidoreductase subunit A [Planctomycetota bacterium]|nr:NADH-quinone oxidoreductase subunit A [Planctomycetota bacterium]MDE2216293.1 NADH-quinone oxidoreductase subunit A [Planctomycetota bacterium]